MSTKGEIRLCIRREGDFANAYIAPKDTMQDALLIGSISTSICNMRPGLFDEFVACMENAIRALVEVGIGGQVLKMQREPAPEHEKAGRA